MVVKISSLLPLPVEDPPVAERGDGWGEGCYPCDYSPVPCAIIIFSVVEIFYSNCFNNETRENREKLKEGFYHPLR